MNPGARRMMPPWLLFTFGGTQEQRKKESLRRQEVARNGTPKLGGDNATGYCQRKSL